VAHGLLSVLCLLLISKYYFDKLFFLELLDISVEQTACMGKKKYAILFSLPILSVRFIAFAIGICSLSDRFLRNKKIFFVYAKDKCYEKCSINCSSKFRSFFENFEPYCENKALNFIYFSLYR